VHLITHVKESLRGSQSFNLVPKGIVCTKRLNISALEPGVSDPG
jgi:hypothetical protein